MSKVKQRISECASLGISSCDKAVLGLFGLISLIHTTDRRRYIRLRSITQFLPKMWLKPQQLGGLQLLIDPTDRSQTVIFDEIFLRNSYDLSKVPFTPDIIVDCGAHIGLFSLLAKSKFPKASHIAYEPNPRNAWFIRKVIRRNRLDVVLHEMAISTESKVLDFVAINSHGGRLSTGDFAGISSEGAQTYRVQTVVLSEVIRKSDAASVLLKMDIEGEERNVLPTVLPVMPRKTALFVETHHGDDGWADAQKLLRQNGFEVEKINSRDIYCDGFAVRVE